MLRKQFAYSVSIAVKYEIWPTFSEGQGQRTVTCNSFSGPDRAVHQL